MELLTAADIMVSIMTIDRHHGDNYLSRTLSSYFKDPLSDAIALNIVLGSPSTRHLEPISSTILANVNIMEMSKSEWEDIASLDIRARLVKNYVRCLSLACNGYGHLILEDDLLFREGAMQYLLDAINEMRSHSHSLFSLSIYSPHDLRKAPFYRGETYCSYGAGYYGNQGVFFSSSAIPTVRRRQMVADRPADLVLGRWMQDYWSGYATCHSLVQHIGRRTTGVAGFWHQSPTFNLPMVCYSPGFVARPYCERNSLPPECTQSFIFRRRDALGGFLNLRGLRLKGVEIGVYKGEFAYKILRDWEGETLFLVDPWKHSPDWRDPWNVSDEEFESVLAEAQERLKVFGERAQFMRMTSTKAAKQFEDGSLEFVYIDGNHSFASVTADLHAWYSKIRFGGLLLGHDYLDKRSGPATFEVKSAVDNFMSRIGRRVEVTDEPHATWFIIK